MNYRIKKIDDKSKEKVERSKLFLKRPTVQYW